MTGTNPNRRSNVLVLRHGETDYRAQDRYQGDSELPRLTEKGKRQSAGFVEYLSHMEVDRVYCSSLTRAIETLEFVRTALPHDVSIRIVADLKEVSIPEWLGRLKSEIMRSEPDRLIHWRTQPSSFVTAGNLRPLSDLYQRVSVVADEIANLSGTTLVIGHDHSNRAMISSLMKVGPSLHHMIPQSLSALSILHADPFREKFDLRASNLEHGQGHTLPLSRSVGPRLLLIRHGVTAANMGKIYQGSARDLPLDSIGFEQVRRLSSLLAAVNPVLVVSSGLQRAIQTAECLTFAERAERSLDPRLSEYDYGHWSGLQAREVHDRFPHEVVAWRTVEADRPIAGAEPISELVTRVTSAVEDAWDIARSGSGSTVALVAHDVVIRVAIAVSLGLGVSDAWLFPIENAALSELVMRPTGQIMLTRHNVLPGRLTDRHDHEYF